MVTDTLGPASTEEWSGGPDFLFESGWFCGCLDLQMTVEVTRIVPAGTPQHPSSLCSSPLTLGVLSHWARVLLENPIRGLEAYGERLGCGQPSPPKGHEWG